MQKSNFSSAVNTIIIGVAFIVAVYLTLQKVDKFLQIKAVDDCGKISRYEVSPDEKTKITYPLGDVYKQCLKDKGY